MSEYNGRTAACDVASFVIGAAVGAGIMLLLAPKAGKDTREDLARKIGELKDQTQDVLNKALRLFRRGLADTAAED